MKVWGDRHHLKKIMDYSILIVKKEREEKDTWHVKEREREGERANKFFEKIYYLVRLDYLYVDGA